MQNRTAAQQCTWAFFFDAYNFTRKTQSRRWSRSTGSFHVRRSSECLTNQTWRMSSAATLLPPPSSGYRVFNNAANGVNCKCHRVQYGLESIVWFELVIEGGILLYVYENSLDIYIPCSLQGPSGASGPRTPEAQMSPWGSRKDHQRAASGVSLMSFRAC